MTTQDEFLKEKLESLGVQVSIQHFEGDNSFPIEYTLRYSFVRGVGPTLDMAVAEFVEKLLKCVPVEKAHIADYNREMDERNRIAYENRDKPWLPGNDE
jgi:hypothetical protein